MRNTVNTARILVKEGANIEAMFPDQVCKSFDLYKLQHFINNIFLVVPTSNCLFFWQCRYGKISFKRRSRCLI